MMKKFSYQLVLNFKRVVLRNPGFLVGAVLLPIVFYLVFTKALNQNTSSEWNLNYLASMIVYGILLGSVMTTTSVMIGDVQGGYNKLLRLTPISKWSFYLNMLVTFEVLNLLCILGISSVGVMVNQVQLHLKAWLGLILVVPLASLPLILIGFIISRGCDYSLGTTVSNLIIFPLAIVSGLWLPIELLPKWMQTVGKVMPTYYLRQLTFNLINGQSLGSKNCLWIGGWLLVLLGLLVILTKFKTKEV